MDEQTKRIAILAAAIVLAVCIYVYFSPYQSCVRAVSERDTAAGAAVLCRSHSN